MARWEPGSGQRLQAAALELFSDQGFEGTTVGDIATRVGVDKRTFFRHFADKRDVLFAGSEQLQRALTEAIAAAPDQLSPLTAVTTVLAGFDWEAIATRTDQRRRQEAIDASPELIERELIKFSLLTAAIADSLRARGADTPTASLAAQTAMMIFRTAHREWTNPSDQRPMVEIIKDLLGRLRLILET